MARKTAPKRRKATRQRARARALDWRPAFLAAFALTGVVLDACDAVPVDHSTVYREVKANVGFAEAFEDARRMGAQTLVKEATRRAVKGCTKPMLYKGEPVRLNKDDAEDLPGFIEARDKDGTGLGWGYLFETEYSDRLMELLLKRHFPDEFREKLAQVNVSASATASAHVTNDAELASIQAARQNFLARLAHPGTNPGQN